MKNKKNYIYFSLVCVLINCIILIILFCTNPKNKANNNINNLDYNLDLSNEYQEHLSFTNEYDSNTNNELTIIDNTIINNLDIQNEDLSAEDTLTSTENLKELVTDTQIPIENPKEIPTNTPKPTEKPKEIPTNTPKPTEKPKEIPTNTPKLTEKPKEIPTNTPKPTEKPKEVERCTNINNHALKVGNSNMWFNSKSEAIKYYEEKIKYWGDLWEANKIDNNTYYKNCPQGYEIWSCMYCSKWSINFYYN